MDITKVGIVGLGRWAKVLTRAAAKSSELEIVAGYSRSEEKRAGVRAANSASRRCPTSPTMLADPDDQGRDPDRAERAAPAAGARGREGRQARLHREADRQHARGRARDRRRSRRRYGVTVTVGHSARLMAGIRAIRAGDRRAASSAASPSWRRISPTSARSSSRRRPGAGTRTARRAARCRSSRSISSTCCTISAARSPRRARWRRSSRRSAPRSTTSR